MFPWLMVWAPQFHYPFSGSVAQQIEPNWFFDAIPPDAGDGRIEQQAFEVASYGRQLGLLSEVLIALADQQPALSNEANASLTRLKAIQAEIEKIKQREAGAPMADLETQLRTQLRSLQQSNPAEFARVSSRLRPLLAKPLN